MNWINLNVAVLDSEEYLGAPPVSRATWLNILRFCVGQENGGRIEGAKQWKDRKWQQLVGVTAKEVGASCDLWTWEGDDLIVFKYPSDKEDEVRRKRENGTKGGRPAKPRNNHVVSDEITTCPNSPETEEKGKGKEGEEKGSTPNPPDGELQLVGEESKVKAERVLPERWKNIPKQDRVNQRVLRNNRMMERIGAWFNRRPGTLWTIAEAVSLQDLQPTSEDIEDLEAWYLAPEVGDRDIRRTSLQTLLNNWSIDLDRARLWKASIK